MLVYRDMHQISHKITTFIQESKKFQCIKNIKSTFKKVPFML